MLSSVGDSKGEEVKRNREEIHVEEKERRRIDTYERERERKGDTRERD